MIDPAWGFDVDADGYPTEPPRPWAHSGENIGPDQKNIVNRLITDASLITYAMGHDLNAKGVRRMLDLAMKMAGDEGQRMGLRSRAHQLLWTIKTRTVPGPNGSVLPID